MAEVLKMSDHVLVLDHGKIIQEGHPLEIFSNEKLNGNFQVTGEIVSIENQNPNLVLTVLIGKEIAKIVVNQTDNPILTLGDQILISSPLFEPTIKKLN